VHLIDFQSSHLCRDFIGTLEEAPNLAEAFHGFFDECVMRRQGLDRIRSATAGVQQGNDFAVYV